MCLDLQVMARIAVHCSHPVLQESAVHARLMVRSHQHQMHPRQRTRTTPSTETQRTPTILSKIHQDGKLGRTRRRILIGAGTENPSAKTLTVRRNKEKVPRMMGGNLVRRVGTRIQPSRIGCCTSNQPTREQRSMSMGTGPPRLAKEVAGLTRCFRERKVHAQTKMRLIRVTSPGRGAKDSAGDRKMMLKSLSRGGGGMTAHPKSRRRAALRRICP
mmetsp:Transcript_58838/g.140313  ORF Transcript_58838/g.140313 Transcript_58838/m.140313 type:complete len:216 (-) Transcript_58838:548-1195(-)